MNVRRMQTLAFLLLALLALGACAGVGASSTQNTSTDGQYTQVYTMQRGDLTASISVVGQLYAPQNESLRFEHMTSSTNLLSLVVAAGNTVQVGQVLATIDPAPYQQALDQARSDLQDAEEKLTALQTPATALEVARADLAVARAELALQQAQERLNDLIQPDLIDLRAKVADAQLALAQAQADLLALRSDTATAERITKLIETENKRAAEHTRLTNESYTDSYYQDRLLVAYNALRDAQDARITAEVQQQMNLLRAEMQVTQAEQQLVDARSALAEAQTGGDELATASARQAVAQAETDLVAAREDRAALDEGANATAVAAAHAAVDKRRLAVAEAEAALAGATLTAPFAATILQTNVAAGDRIAANTIILTLANLDELQVVAAVDETTIQQVTVDQAVQITFDAFPDRSFSGEVLSVPLQGTLQGDVMVYDVPVSLIGAEDLPLRVGMTANAVIQIGQVENALLAPTLALQKVNGLYQVQIPQSANADGAIIATAAVPVEIGLSNGVYTQIVRGLNEGDQVVVQIESSNTQSDFRAMRALTGDTGGPLGGGPPPGAAQGANRP